LEKSDEKELEITICGTDHKESTPNLFKYKHINGSRETGTRTTILSHKDNRPYQRYQFIYKDDDIRIKDSKTRKESNKTLIIKMTKGCSLTMKSGTEQDTQIAAARAEIGEEMHRRDSKFHLMRLLEKTKQSQKKWSHFMTALEVTELNNLIQRAEMQLEWNQSMAIASDIERSGENKQD